MTLINAAISGGERVKMENVVFVKLHPASEKKLVKLIAAEIKATLCAQDRLMGLKELAAELNVSERTLQRKKSLPYHKVGRSGRKMYKVKEVVESLKKAK